MNVNVMDVDVGGSSVSDGEGSCGPSSSGGAAAHDAIGVQPCGKLKRSSSAPMINQLLPQGPVSAPPTPTPSR